MKKTVKAAIIDDGVYLDGVEQYIVTKDRSIIRFNNVSKTNSHGTLCYQIFKNTALQSNCISICLEYQDEKGGFNTQHLIDALEWCIAQNVQLISLSLGTSFINEFSNFEAVLTKMKEQNIILVAAINNTNCLTCPGSINGIIGVRYDKENKLEEGTYAFMKDELTGTNIIAHPVSIPKITIYPENSFATPYLAACICNRMNEHNKTYSSIINWLEESSAVQYKEFSKDYYQRILPNKANEPIFIAVLDRNSKIGRLGKLFSQNQYTVVELECSQTIYWKQMDSCYSIKRWDELTDFIIRSTNPDIIFWYMPSNSIEHARTSFFDAVVEIQESDKSDWGMKLLNEDGLSFSYTEKDYDVESIYRDICNAFT